MKRILPPPPFYKVSCLGGVSGDVHDSLKLNIFSFDRLVLMPSSSSSQVTEAKTRMFSALLKGFSRERGSIQLQIAKKLVNLFLFIPLREDDPLILSCAGSFNEEGALSLWQRQREEVSSYSRSSPCNLTVFVVLNNWCFECHPLNATDQACVHKNRGTGSWDIYWGKTVFWWKDEDFQWKDKCLFLLFWRHYVMLWQ